MQKVFAKGGGVDRKYVPKKSNDLPDLPTLTLVVLGPDQPATDPATRQLITAMTMESGSSSRTFKSALIWAVAEDSAGLAEEVRKLLAWKEIKAESDEMKLEGSREQQLEESLKKAERDLLEAVWRAYKNVFLLTEDGTLRHIDLGLVHSSAAGSLHDFILGRLKQEDLVADGVSPNFLIRYWPPALPEWSTKNVRDAFYASPKFPRLLKQDAVKETISRGLDNGLLAYVGKAADGTYQPFVYKKPMAAADIELSDEMFIIPKDRADAYLAHGSTKPPAPIVEPQPPRESDRPVEPPEKSGDDRDRRGHDTSPPPEIPGFTWTGEVSSQKWMNFYTKVLSKFATGSGLRLTVTVEVAPPGGLVSTRLEETRNALRELGLDEAVKIKGR